MDNNKLLDVTNYFLENANNGILNIIDNSKSLQEYSHNDILNEENIKKVHYLYKVVTLDIEEYLKTSYNYLKNKLKFIKDISFKKYKKARYIQIDITLKQQIGKSDIIFRFYIVFYYTNDYIKEKCELEHPIVAFELYLDRDKYDLNFLRKLNYPTDYDKLPEWFEDDWIYAYDTIDYQPNLTSQEISDKATKFLEQYLNDRIKDIKKAYERNSTNNLS